MPVLLRCPAAVPALFSGAFDPEPPTCRRATASRGLVPTGIPLGAVSVFAAVLLIEVPLFNAAAVLRGLGLPG